MESEDFQLLRRMSRHKATEPVVHKGVGEEMLAFFKQVQKRQVKLAEVARVWEQLVPKMFLSHTCLESLSGGTLTVMVDSASHLYELRQLMLSGLEKQLIIACKKAGVRKLSLKRGTWYDLVTGRPTF